MTNKNNLNEPPPPYSAPYPTVPGVAYPTTSVSTNVVSTHYPQQAGFKIHTGSMPTATTHAQPATVIVNVQNYGPFPQQVTCAYCNATSLTETISTPGLLAWLLSGALCFVGLFCGCCLIPCCIPSCQDVIHRCPNCKQTLGVYRRL